MYKRLAVTICLTLSGGIVTVATKSSVSLELRTLPTTIVGSAHEPLTLPTVSAPLATRPVRSPIANRVVRPRVSRVRPQPLTSGPWGAGTPSDVQLWALSGCESGHRQTTAGPFHSYFQWMLPTYHNLGGEGAPEAHDYEYQAALARKINLSAWPSQFPGCTRKLRAQGVL